jgi:hypothetical protein
MSMITAHSERQPSRAGLATNEGALSIVQRRAATSRTPLRSLGNMLWANIAWVAYSPTKRYGIAKSGSAPHEDVLDVQLRLLGVQVLDDALEQALVLLGVVGLDVVLPTRSRRPLPAT